jgi:hypothetical protein
LLRGGGFLVVAADVSLFEADHPTVAPVVGGWPGKLSDSSDTVELVNRPGVLVDRVTYFDEGEWSSRELGPVDHSHRGWQWSDLADGGGRSLERINPAMPSECGQNWSASKAIGGTPGQANSVAATDAAPFILEVVHSPVIPRPTDQVTVTAYLLDELSTGLRVTLCYRVDGQSAFTQETMMDDGAHGDGPANDRTFGARIPAQLNKAIVEFYVEAHDAAGNVRTWPAPANVDGTAQQVTNALYQVDSTFDPQAPWVAGGQPVYYLIMTETERAELALIGKKSNGEEDSDAQMNGTFISRDETGVELRYSVGIHNRGHGTRTGPPNNYHVHFPHDRPWRDRSAIDFNCRYTHAQIIGSAIYRLAGLVAADADAVRLRVNGANLASSGSPMYGVYVGLEAFDDQFAESHFPDDPHGNLYACFRTDADLRADLGYEGETPDTYRDRYFKANNQAEDDWSDLIHLVDVLNNAPDATYIQDVNQVVNIPQWLRYIALDSLLGNYETGLNMGIGDDYFLYCGVKDPRFILIPHDLDTILWEGNSKGAIDQSVFSIVKGVSKSYDGVDGLKRLFNRPEIIPLYYQAFLDLIQDCFNPETLDPLSDQTLGGFTPKARLDSMKQFVRNRTAAVLAQIPEGAGH